MCSIEVGGGLVGWYGEGGDGGAGWWGYVSFKNLTNSAEGFKLHGHEAAGGLVKEDCAKQATCVVLCMIDSK